MKKTLFFPCISSHFFVYLQNNREEETISNVLNFLKFFAKQSGKAERGS